MMEPPKAFRRIEFWKQVYLTGKNRKARTAAVRAIAGFPGGALYLASCLSAENDPEVLEAMTHFVMDWGEPGLTTLSQLLEHPSPRIRAAAASTLCERAPHLENGYIDSLFNCLGDNNLEILACVTRAFRLAGIERVVGALRASFPERGGGLQALDPLLKAADCKVRARVAFVLAELGERALGTYQFLVRDPESFVRRGAVLGLGRLGEKSLGHLLPAAGDADPGVRFLTATVLEGVKHPLSIATLIRLLRDEIPRVRARAAYSLATVGRGSFVALDALGPLFRDNSADVRWAAFSCLVEFGRSALRFLPEIRTALRDEDESVRARAIGLLGYYTDYHEEKEAFFSALRDESPDVRFEGGCAIKEHLRHHPLDDWTERQLLSLSEDARSELRSFAVQAIGECREPGGRLMSVLVRLLFDKERKVREGAASYLEGFSADVLLGFLPAIKRGLADKSPEVRKDLVFLFEKMGPKAMEAIPELCGRLTDSDPEVRFFSARALSVIDPRLTANLPILTDTLLSCYHADFRRMAASALGALGSDAGEVIDALQLATEDPYDGVRAAAVNTLESIRALKPSAIQ